MRKSGLISGTLFAVLAAACWGSATVMSKAALSQFPPVLLLSVQLSASVCALWLVVLLRGPSWRSLRGAISLAWLGLLEPGLAYLLGLLGLTETEAGSAVLVQASESIMIALLAAAFLREHLSGRFLVLSSVAFAGIIAAITPASGIGIEDLAANGLVMLGTFVAAIYVVLSGHLVGERDPVTVICLQQTAALIAALGLLPFVDITISTGGSLNTPWDIAILSGIVQYALAFPLYLAAMRRIGTSLAGTFLNLVPIVGLVGAVLFLGEPLSTQQLFGAAVTIGSLLLLTRMNHHSS